MYRRIIALLLCLCSLLLCACRQNKQQETSTVSNTSDTSEESEALQTTPDILYERTYTVYKLTNPDGVPSYYGSGDYPMLYLESGGNNFMYVCYAYAPPESYLYYGHYEIDGNKYMFTTADGLTEFTLYNGIDGLTASKDCPFPFTSENCLFVSQKSVVSADASSMIFAAGETIYWDIDEDGCEEICVLSIGPTSGVSSLYLSVYEECTLDYCGVIYWFSAYFDSSEDEVKIVCRDYGSEEGTLEIEITVDAILLKHPSRDDAYEITKQ